MMRRCQPWLGTLVEIRADFAKGDVAEFAFKKAFEAVGRVHRLMSPQDARSDVARMNRAPLDVPTYIDAWTRDVLIAAQSFRQMTNGAFNVCFAMQKGGREVSPELPGALRSMACG